MLELCVLSSVDKIQGTLGGQGEGAYQANSKAHTPEIVTLEVVECARVQERVHSISSRGWTRIQMDERACS